MDIYSFIRSHDVAEHCRNIGKTWNTCEMAVIIARSDRTIAEKHTAWQELIDSYPDMPNIPSFHKIQFESIHKRLAEMMDYERRLMERFKTAEEGMYYRYHLSFDDYCDDYYSRVYTSFEKALASLTEEREEYRASEIMFEKSPIDGDDDYDRRIEARADLDGNIYSINMYANEELHSEWFPGIDYNALWEFDLESLIFIHIPLPFKRGDLLTCGSHNPAAFVLDGGCDDNSEWYAKALRGEKGDGSDMIGWGLFVDDVGALYGDHTDFYDCFEYYTGKLEGKDRLLHYVSLFIKGEIGLQELLTMQCRIVVERMLSEEFSAEKHGCYIPKELLAENRKED